MLFVLHSESTAARIQGKASRVVNPQGYASKRKTRVYFKRKTQANVTVFHTASPKFTVVSILVRPQKKREIDQGWEESLDWNPMQEEEKKTYLNIENRNFRSKAKSGKKLKNNKATKKTPPA